MSVIRDHATARSVGGLLVRTCSAASDVVAPAMLAFSTGLRTVGGVESNRMVVVSCVDRPARSIAVIRIGNPVASDARRLYAVLMSVITHLQVVSYVRCVDENGMGAFVKVLMIWSCSSPTSSVITIWMINMSLTNCDAPITLSMMRMEGAVASTAVFSTVLCVVTSCVSVNSAVIV